MIYSFSSLLSFLLFTLVLVASEDPKPQQIAILNLHQTVTVDPKSQNIPLNESFSHLRPPPPRIPNEYDTFVGLSAFRDGLRCGYTVFTGFKRSKNPDRIFFGIVDQISEGDSSCLDEYCKLANKEWPEHGPCRYKSQVRVTVRSADESRGPTLARHYQQKLIQNEEFCLQLDAHSVFTNLWDEHLVKEWARTENEMAVLTPYLHHLHDFVKEDGTNNPPSQLPHLCTTIRGGNKLVRNEGASMLINPQYPQMTALWGAGLSFSKCHAEKRVVIDSHTLWMFDGEEFLRSSHLWTYGYDMYSPSPLGSVVYHNYTKVPARFEHVRVDPQTRERETEMGSNRFRLVAGIPFKGLIDTFELEKFEYGKVRSFKEYLRFSGITFEPNQTDQHSCRQLHWIPFDNPKDVEELLPGWNMVPKPVEIKRKPIEQTPDKVIVVNETPKTTPKSSSKSEVEVKKNQQAGANANAGVGGVRNIPTHENVVKERMHEEVAIFRRNKEVVVDDSTTGITTFHFFGLIGVFAMVVMYTNDSMWRKAKRFFRIKSTNVSK